MLTLFHHPFCPHSRFVRLALGEYGIRTRGWSRSACGSGARSSSPSIRPAPRRCWWRKAIPPVPGAAIIAEYLDETRGAELGERRLLPREHGARVEVRRLIELVQRQVLRRGDAARWSRSGSTSAICRSSSGGGPPDTDAIRAARHNIRYHLAYIGWLVRTRDWLAGDRLSYADLAAAAHLSAADYLGDVPWNEDEAAKTWYARVKSRPSFRPLLAETLAGIPPSQTYADLDF